MRVIITSILMFSLLVACNRQPVSTDPLSLEQGGPDASNVQPRLPLSVPNVLTLPEPTPGGSNLTDP